VLQRPEQEEPLSRLQNSHECQGPANEREVATMRARETALITCITMQLLGIASAAAEPCSQEIMDVTKKLAVSDQTAEMLGKGTSSPDAQRQLGVISDASQALERARGLDAQGKEAECMTEVMNARQLAGL
jgi:hypothetical protein